MDGETAALHQLTSRMIYLFAASFVGPSLLAAVLVGAVELF